MTDAKTRNSPTIDRELADWLLAHDRGLTDDDIDAFDTWLRQSPAHGRAWGEAATLWQGFDHAEADEDLAAMLHEARSARPAPKAYFQPRRMAVGGGLLLAATLAVVIGVPRQTAPGPSIAEQRYATGLRPAQYRLADGTQLTLDAGSALSFSSDGTQRIASLSRGRAYLDVHHDAGAPFRVRAGGATITDEGTRFGVASENGTLSVTLAAGKVAILDRATGAAAVHLVPGQRFTRSGGAPGVISFVKADAALSWRDGFVEFDRVPLATAIAELNRYTADPVRIADDKAGRFLVSGRFEAGDPKRFASLLALTYPVRLTTDRNGRATLRSK